MSTKPMRVANIAFLLDRLAADTPPNQQIRELTQNALEAITRRQKAGDTEKGLIRWDVDWDHYSRTKQYKLCVVDDGDGMTPEQMEEYLNSLAVAGANQTQSISQNFGVGAKITALFRNRYGLVYQSWHDGKGAMVKLHRDDARGEYGLASISLDDGPHWSPRLKNVFKPKVIKGTGTKVTLLGAEDDENTCLPPEKSGAMNWLVRYLNTRYFRIPDTVRIQVRILTTQAGDWPEKEPRGGEKTFNLQTITGLEYLFTQYACKNVGSGAKGTVRLATADAHWWVFNDPVQASKDMSTRGGRTCQVGVVFQNEVYLQRLPPTARRILAGFGVIFGAEHIVIYIEPRANAGIDIRADTARSRLIIEGEDLEEANWWETWGNEFREKLPKEIKAKIDEIMARTESDPEGKVRNRVLERLRRIHELMRPSRYRVSPTGKVYAIGEAQSGAPGRAPGVRESGRSGGKGRGRAGRGNDDYLADLVDSGGELAIKVDPPIREPTVRWVSIADGSRPEDELNDMAAEIAGDPASGDIIKANADFRGYRDIVEQFGRAFNLVNDEVIQHRITESVREWMELQLIEAVMTVRNLANGRTWTAKDVQEALSPRALTTLLMTRFHIYERVKRQLGTDLPRSQ